MTDDAEQKAWREYCRKLEAIGVDPYAPELSHDDPRHEQTAVIVAEYQAATAHKLALPPTWEGHVPVQAVDSLIGLAGWLTFQWQLVKAGELAGDRAKLGTLRGAALAMRNAFRVLEWLGVQDRPERPRPPETLDDAKQQIDGLEGWIRQQHKTGWKPSPKPVTPTKTRVSVNPGKRSDAIPDDEANILVRDFLGKNPKATCREVSDGIGIALGRVPKMAAWRAEVGRRKADKSGQKKTPIQLTKEMTEFIKKGDDPAEVVMLRDGVWNKIIAAAQGKKAELEKLYALTNAQRELLIDASLEQYRDQLEEQDDDDD